MPHFLHSLLSWYEANKRDLPWRRASTPYAVWISEIMLQQTQVNTALPYYSRFLSRFPNAEALADASLEEVLKEWEGLGYYSRARHLHSAAREVLARYGGELPGDYARLRELPGIGAYSAAAIASIAFNQAFPVVDGNVHRVFARILALGDPPAACKNKIEAFLKRIIPVERPAAFNQAIMELGALVCAPRNPACGGCPVQKFCKAFQEGRVKDFPVRGARKALPDREWVALVVESPGGVLLGQRPCDGLWGGLWELPSFDGKPAALRFLRKFLGKTRRGKLQKLAPISHAFTHFKLTIHPFWIKVKSTPLLPAGFVWENKRSLQKPIPAPHLKIIRWILKPPSAAASRFPSTPPGPGSN